MMPSMTPESQRSIGDSDLSSVDSSPLPQARKPKLLEAKGESRWDVMPHSKQGFHTWGLYSSTGQEDKSLSYPPCKDHGNWGSPLLGPFPDIHRVLEAMSV